MKAMTMKHRGEDSATLFFVFVSWAVLVIKFAIAGLTIPGLGAAPQIGPAEFGGAALMILGVWIGREYTEKVKKPQAGGA